MTHTPACKTRRELTGNIWVNYSEPDPACTDKTHTDAYTEATK